MVNLFHQPYPTEEPVSRRLIKALGVSTFVGLFLLLFQPFGLYDWVTAAKSVKILGFGGITLMVMLANYFVLPVLFPRYFSDDRWTVGREITRVLIYLLFIALCNQLYLAWLLNEPLMVGGWLRAIGVTFLLAVFPIVVLILLSYIRQLRKYSRLAEELPIHTPEPTAGNVTTRQAETPVEAVLTLVADNEKDTLTLPASELLFIESSDNYCTVVYPKNNQLLKPLLRSSLSRLEKQIDQPRIIRCHRSFVVNLDRVERVTGNAQGYKLHLADSQFQIPVARQYNETLVSELKAL